MKLIKRQGQLTALNPQYITHVDKADPTHIRIHVLKSLPFVTEGDVETFTEFLSSPNKLYISPQETLAAELKSVYDSLQANAFRGDPYIERHYLSQEAKEHLTNEGYYIIRAGGKFLIHPLPITTN